jgi:hypothetical protein
VSGFGLVAGVAALFFACGILTGVLGVMALSAMRGHRARGERHRGFGEYEPNQTQPIDLTPRNRPDEDDDLRPPWPGRRG